MAPADRNTIQNKADGVELTVNHNDNDTVEIEVKLIGAEQGMTIVLTPQEAAQVRLWLDTHPHAETSLIDDEPLG